MRAKLTFTTALLIALTACGTDTDAEATPEPATTTTVAPTPEEETVDEQSNREDLTAEIKDLYLDSGAFVTDAYRLESIDGTRPLHVHTELIWDWSNENENESNTHRTALAMCEAAAMEYGDIKVNIYDRDGGLQVQREVGGTCE